MAGEKQENLEFVSTAKINKGNFGEFRFLCCSQGLYTSNKVRG